MPCAIPRAASARQPTLSGTVAPPDGRDEEPATPVRAGHPAGPTPEDWRGRDAAVMPPMGGGDVVS